jgi:hypothetical protein
MFNMFARMLDLAHIILLYCVGILEVSLRMLIAEEKLNNTSLKIIYPDPCLNALNILNTTVELLRNPIIHSFQCLLYK